MYLITEQVEEWPKFDDLKKLISFSKPMKEYRVKIDQSAYYEFVVKAETEDEAELKAWQEFEGAEKPDDYGEAAVYDIEELGEGEDPYAEVERENGRAADESNRAEEAK